VVEMDIVVTPKLVPVKQASFYGEEIYYIDIGSEEHGKPSFKLWVSSELVMDGITHEGVVFPAHADIVKTKSGELVLVPSNKTATYYFYVKCGYRGVSHYEVIVPPDTWQEKNKRMDKYPFKIYDSPRGNLGINEGAIVVVEPRDDIIVKWIRTGRLYDTPRKGITILYRDSNKQELPNVDDYTKILEVKEIANKDEDEDEDEERPRRRRRS
jgi:hypothetical protein